MPRSSNHKSHSKRSSAYSATSPCSSSSRSKLPTNDLACYTPSYLFTAAGSRVLTSRRLRQYMENNALIAVLGVEYDAIPSTLARMFPEKDARIPVISVQVSWDAIVRGAGGNVDAKDVWVHGHVMLCTQGQYEKIRREKRKMTVVRVGGEGVRGGVQWGEREVICFVDGT